MLNALQEDVQINTYVHMLWMTWLAQRRTFGILVMVNIWILRILSNINLFVSFCLCHVRMILS